MTKEHPYHWLRPGSRNFLRMCLLAVVLSAGSLVQAAEIRNDRPAPDESGGQSVQEDSRLSEVLGIRFTLPRQSTTVYAALNQLSRETGYYFIYDSDLIDNDRRIRLPRATRTMGEFLSEILEDQTLGYRVLEQHILIYRQEADAASPVADTVETGQPEPRFFSIQGRVLEYGSGNPLPFASVSIPGKGKGIAANKEGGFALRLPMELIDTVVRFSYMGFKAKEMPLRLLTERNVDVILEADYISMQEVIIRYYDPNAIIREALEKRYANYSNHPVYLTSFYREGVQRNTKLMRYSEAVLRVYKPAYTSITDSEQVKLLKSRHITNVEATDSLELRLEAGVGSSLELDFMRNIPDFLNPETIGQYRFVKADIVSYNSRSTYAIEFIQAARIDEALYMGVLYVDMETLAFVGAEFEVNPKYVNKDQSIFIRRRSRDYVANIQRVAYTVRYQQFDGRYILEHVRGEISLRFRHRGKFFGNNYTAFFEHAVCHIDTENVRRFQRRETIRTNTVFSDKVVDYDYSFWGDYNFISPEKEITGGLADIRAKIQNIVFDD